MVLMRRACYWSLCLNITGKRSQGGIPGVQNGMNGMQEVVTCNSTTTAISLPSTCAGGYVCAPLPNADIRAANNAAESAASWGLTPPANPLPGAHHAWPHISSSDPVCARWPG